MADTTIPMKFTGNGQDLERAIASLEKKYTDLEAKIVNAKSAAKTAAQQAKEDLKNKEKAEAEAARKQRELDRQVAADAREARRRKEREENQARRKSERDDADAKREKARKERENERDRRQEARETQRQVMAAEREAAREKARIERDEIRRQREAAAERKRIAREEAREKAKIRREEERERKKIEREEKRALEQQQQWVGGIFRAMAAYVGITTILSTILTQNEKLIQQADEWGDKQDKLSRGFALQASMSALQGKGAQDSINKEALIAAIPVEKASGAATQLVSSGFTANQASGPALRKLLAGQAAAGDADGDAEKFALSVSQIMSAANLPKTAENVERVTRDIYALKKLGNLKAEDMEFIAPKIQGFITQGGSLEEGLAAFATMEETTNREQAATGSKIMWERLMGANGRKIEKHLKAVGLKPEQVDFIGESQLDVAKTLKTAFDQLPQEKRQPAIQSIFGNEAGSAVTGFLNHLDRYQEFVEGQKDTKGFDDAVKLMQSGSDVARKRSNIRKELQIAGMKDDTTLILDALEYELRQAGYAEAQIWGRRTFADTRRLFGGNTEQAARYMVDYGSEGESMYARALAAVREQKGGEAIEGISKRSQLLLDTKFPKIPEEPKVVNEPQLAKPDVIPVEMKPRRQVVGKAGDQVSDAAPILNPAVVEVIQRAADQPHNAEAVEAANLQIMELTDALKANTEATLGNTERPPDRRRAKPVNANE